MILKLRVLKRKIYIIIHDMTTLLSGLRYYVPEEK